jgi:hypothetical protein
MIALILLSSTALAGGQTDSLSVQVDSARREVVLDVELPASRRSTAEHLHSGHSTEPTAIFGWTGFRWPVDGWVRGFRLDVWQCDRPDSTSSILHHLIIANLARRQLVHPAMERLLAVGSETPDVVLPKTVGVPLDRGTPLAIKIAWSQPKHDECGVHFRIAVLWSPENLVPAPMSVMPFYADVYHEDVLASNVFDLAPGRSFQSWDFRMPISGRLLAAGAHLHPFAEQLALISLPESDTLTRLRAHMDDATGRLEVDQKRYGVSGRGLRLRGEHRYRLVSQYLNPSDSTLSSAGMAHLVGLFAPDDPSAWPAFDAADPILAEDYRRVCGRPHPGCRHSPESQKSPRPRLAPEREASWMPGERRPMNPGG